MKIYKFHIFLHHWFKAEKTETQITYLTLDHWLISVGSVSNRSLTANKNYEKVIGFWSYMDRPSVTHMQTLWKDL